MFLARKIETCNSAADETVQPLRAMADASAQLRSVVVGGCAGFSRVKGHFEILSHGWVCGRASDGDEQQRSRSDRRGGHF